MTSGHPRVVVIGGGLAGLAGAIALAEEGWTAVTVLESSARLGGLAGSFEHVNRFYPLGYHHILSRDRTLLFFLDRIDALNRVKWRKIRMLFETETGLYNLGDLVDFWRFPLPLPSKARFLRLMLRAFAKTDWSDWRGRPADALLEAWADETVRKALFDPLVQLKFQRDCSEISAEWLGLRLSYREGSAPIGYIPDTNWTTVLCDGMERLCRSLQVTLRTGAAVQALRVCNGAAVGVTLADGTDVSGDVFFSTVPTAAYRELCSDDRTPHLDSVRYTALLSMVCATEQQVAPEFYWLNLATRRHRASAIFNLSALNPTIANPGETCLNFVTHLGSHTDRIFRSGDNELIAEYLADFHRIFGYALQPSWVKLSRVPIYSPVFVTGYQAPPAKSASIGNVYFAGNYSGSPSIASTGSAMASGLATAQRILREHGQDSSLYRQASAFRAPNGLLRNRG